MADDFVVAVALVNTALTNEPLIDLIAVCDSFASAEQFVRRYEQRHPRGKRRKQLNWGPGYSPTWRYYHMPLKTNRGRTPISRSPT